MERKAIVAVTALLVMASFPAFADTPAADVTTRLEFTVIGRAVPPEPPKKPTADFDPMAGVPEKAALDATAKAVKLASELSAQYPKCHLRIAALEPEAVPSGAPWPPPQGLVIMRASLYGDANCLTAK
jgi:hypothetical protein